MTDKIQCGLRLDEPLLLKVKKLAKEHGVSLNAQMSIIIASYIRDYEAQHGEIKTDR